jgi:hypothetical protein
MSIGVFFASEKIDAVAQQSNANTNYAESLTSHMDYLTTMEQRIGIHYLTTSKRAWRDMLAKGAEERYIS